MKIYIVKAFGGQWEDSWESDIVAVKSEERAKELVEEYQRESDKHHEEMMWYKDNPDKVPEHNYEGGVVVYNPDEVEYFCSKGCKACEVEHYWPSMDDTCYRYEELEMEDYEDTMRG